MAVREDLVSSAVTFLHDPSVASSPLDKRIAFLQSKNLTQEEIDVALARAAEGGAPPPQGQSYGYPQQQIARQPQQGYGYGPYQGYWQPPQPPEVPRRDWRDYFIMATVTGGIGYGLYWVAKRYITPLIAPPTPPQLEQDKAAIDEAFKRAFDLIEQLSADTAEIKSSEEARKEKLDSALVEVEQAVQDMKASTKRRDEDTRRIGDEVRSLQTMIPKALKGQEEKTDERLKELNTELKSLKTLISNRVAGPTAPVAPSQKPAASVNGTGSINTAVNGTASSTSTPTETNTHGTGTAPAPEAYSGSASATPDRSSSSSPFLPYGKARGQAGIPAWQMAAQKQKDDQKPAADVTEAKESEAVPQVAS